MNIAAIVSLFNEAAPFCYQESYDNSGLQVGRLEEEVKGALLSLDITEAVLEEAIQLNCNLIIAHHPLIFSGLKRLTGANYVQRIVEKAIKNDINILAVHTNLDNMWNGVNATIAAKLGLQQTQILAPISNSLYKLYCSVPDSHAAMLRQALFDAGAGHIGAYSECSFSTTGTGSFKPASGAQPFIGQAGGLREQISEQKIEVLVPAHLKARVQQALFAAHPYEELAYEWVALSNENQSLGAGLVGVLPEPMSELAFLQQVKAQMNVQVMRHTELLERPVQKVALCGGSGSFLLKEAIAAGADMFVSADFKYHQFFDAEQKIVIADIGHYETEQFTVEIFDEILRKKNVTFAVLLSKLDTNPIKYF